MIAKRLAELTWKEAETERVRQPIVLVPIGSTEGSLSLYFHSVDMLSNWKSCSSPKPGTAWLAW